MPQGPWQGATWEGTCTFQREGSVSWLLPGLRPPVRCRWHRTTLAGWAEWLEAQPSTLLLLFPSSSSFSFPWIHVGKWRSTSQPQFPTNRKHCSTLCASPHTFSQAPENNPSQINHHHSLTPTPLVVSSLNIFESFIVFSTLWVLSTPVELWIIQREERIGNNKQKSGYSEWNRRRHRRGHRDVHGEIRTKRWVFLSVPIRVVHQEGLFAPAHPHESVCVFVVFRVSSYVQYRGVPRIFLKSTAQEEPRTRQGIKIGVENLQFSCSWVLLCPHTDAIAWKLPLQLTKPQ